MFLFLSVVFRCYYVVRTCPLRCCWLLFSISRSIFVYCSSNSSLIHCTFCALLCVVFLRPRVERPRLLQPLSIYLLSTRIFHRRSLPDVRAAMRTTLFPSRSLAPQPTRRAFSAATLPKKRAVWRLHMLRGPLSANPCLAASASAFSRGVLHRLYSV